MKKIILIVFTFLLLRESGSGQQRLINLVSLLERMKDISHLPELVDSKTAMSSTWDRKGGNQDNADFSDLQGSYNVLLKTEGPGCIFRIFTGVLNENLNHTNLQIFIDNQSKPVIDCPIRDFFTKNQFTAYPFVFGSDRTYPGLLLPIPFSKHIKIQLWSKDDTPLLDNWGNYWQVTYTKYSPKALVKSFSLPLSPQERQQMKNTGLYWINTEQNHTQKPTKWQESPILNFNNKEKVNYTLKGGGIINALGVDVFPNTPDALKEVRFRIYWDGMPFPSVDVPLGYFFGNADYASQIEYSSLFMGIDSTGGYCSFPMPFSAKAKIEFTVPAKSSVKKIALKFNYTKSTINKNWGYFHATWAEQWATHLAKLEGQQQGEFNTQGEFNIPAMPKYGESNIPVHILLDRKGFKGKYVGSFLHVAWPSKNWWGEGDPLFWTDENDWPPSYHGTGSEEYFNSGWGDFDRKAISGFIKKMPGNVMVYSFHTNDAFNFKYSIKLGIERWNQVTTDDTQRCIWGSTAFWYAEFPLPAESQQQLLTPRLYDDLSVPFKEIWK